MNRQKKWEINDLLKRLSRMLDITENDIASLLLKQVDSAGAVEEHLLKQTSMLLMYLHQAAEGIGELQHRIALTALHLMPYVHDEKILATSVRGDYVPGFIYAHIFLAKIGLPDTRFDSLANQFLYTNDLNRTETALERIWLRKNWSGWEIDGPLVKKILADTSLGEPVNFLLVSDQYMNTFANELFYAAAFSRKYWLLPEKKLAILERTEIMLAICIDKEAYGIVASLLLGYRHISKSWTAVTAFAFKLLAALEQEADYTESRLNPVSADSLPSSFTMGHLYTTCLKKGTAPYKKIPPSSIRKGTAQRLVQFHDSNETTTTSWIKYFYLLEEAEQDALSSFLFNCTLIQNIHRQQYEKVSQLLNLGYVLGLANSPVAIQAAEVLNRLESYF